MIAKSVALAFSAPMLLSASPLAEPVYADIPEVRQVMCATTRGTAWRVGSGAFVTARHVALGTDCTIDGEPITVTWESADLDIAILRTAVYGKGLRVNCHGYRDKDGYAGVGYAAGRPVQRVIFVLFVSDLDASHPRWMRFSTLLGAQFIPGMSGGPVFNSAGEVVGIVNGLNRHLPISYSQALKDTPLCAS